MFRPPFAARVAAGIAATIVEEVQKLPSTAVTLPMTAVSQVLQTGMHLQQAVTSLAIKGDDALGILFPQRDEQPEWAVFDEDESAPSAPRVVPDRAEPAPTPVPDGAEGAAGADQAAGASTNGGRFELYSMTPPSDESAPVVREVHSGPHPEIVEYLDYDNLTLAQLRARLRSLSVSELGALLTYEDDTRARAPFQTMLGNRITAATAK